MKLFGVEGGRPGVQQLTNMLDKQGFEPIMLDELEHAEGSRDVGTLRRALVTHRPLAYAAKAVLTHASAQNFIGEQQNSGTGLFVSPHEFSGVNSKPADVLKTYRPLDVFPVLFRSSWALYSQALQRSGERASALLAAAVESESVDAITTPNVISVYHGLQRILELRRLAGWDSPSTPYVSLAQGWGTFGEQVGDHSACVIGIGLHHGLSSNDVEKSTLRLNKTTLNPLAALQLGQFRAFVKDAHKARDRYDLPNGSEFYGIDADLVRIHRDVIRRYRAFTPVESDDWNQAETLGCPVLYRVGFKTTLTNIWESQSPFIVNHYLPAMLQEMKPRPGLRP